jgi:hypothetical protein
MLGLGSPTHPLPESSYAAWASTYRWEQCYGQEYLYAGPLFTHQLSHVWIDFRGIQDSFMRGKGINYFENSRRATYIQQQYAIDNPLKFAGYADIHRSRLAASGIFRGLVMSMAIGNYGSTASGNVQCTEASSAKSAPRTVGTTSVPRK